MCPRNSILVRAAVCVALGIATTFAVAWASAIAVPSNANFDGVQLEFVCELQELVGNPVERHAREVAAWNSRHTSPMPRGRFFSRAPAPLPLTAIVEARPGGTVVLSSWTEAAEQVGIDMAYFPSAKATPYQPWMSEYHDIRGWPFPALGVPWDRAMQAPVVGSGKHLPRIRIPLHPLWAGMAYNTMIFTAFWSMFIIVPIIPELRRRHRRARGRCVKCAYELASLPRCPECGLSA